MENLKIISTGLSQKIGLTNIKHPQFGEYSVWIAVREGNIVGCYGMSTNNSAAKTYGASIWFEKNKIGTSSIDSPEKSGLGAIFMWMMCQIGKEKGLGLFGVSSAVSPYWEQAEREGWLTACDFAEVEGDILIVEKRCLTHAREKGWDMTPLLSLQNYVNFIAKDKETN